MRGLFVLSVHLTLQQANHGGFPKSDTKFAFWFEMFWNGFSFENENRQRNMPIKLLISQQRNWRHFFFSSFNLERSQSLRISKKSLRSLSSKGGSLRLSKKEAANALKQVKEAEENESNCNGELTESTLATPHQSVRI